MVEVLMTVATYVPAEVEGKDQLKPSDLQALRRSAVNLLVTSFACNRGLNFEEMASLLFQVLWAPAARDLSDDNARLRVLTEVEQLAGVGLACHRFRQQVTEARSVQDQAQREATALRQQVAELSEQFQWEQAERKTLAAELEALRTSSANKMAELYAQHEAERMHLRHELEQLRGRLVRRLDDSIEMLEVGLTALRNKTPRTEVMAERAEHVVDALRAESTNLREE
jgi:chromosome segregation ATPase